MKALILNGALKGSQSLGLVEGNIKQILETQGYKVESILLYNHSIAKCNGCFGCWVKTPGVCVIDDYGRDLAENFMKMDSIIWLTPVVFGGYSSEIKKVLDRIIPLVLPFFEKIKGEVHHKARYTKFPNIVVFGVTENHDIEQEEIFVELIKRNSINFHDYVTGKIIKTRLEEDMTIELTNQLKTSGVI